MADGAILQVIPPGLARSAVHLPKSSKTQIIGTLVVSRGYQIEQPGRQLQ